MSAPAKLRDLCQRPGSVGTTQAPAFSTLRLTQQPLETHLWGAANILRGKTAGQGYKNYILSLMFYKRLCDQWVKLHRTSCPVAAQRHG